MTKATSMTVDQAIAQAKKAVRQRRFAEAAAMYESVLRQQPEHPVAKKGLRKLQRSGKPISNEPPAAQIDDLIARVNAGDYSTAESGIRQRLRTWPHSLLLKNLLGVSLQRGGRPDAAIDVFDELLAGSPNFADAHLNLGVALRDGGRLEDAAGAYEKALALNPQNALACYNLANVLKDLGEFDKAIRSYESAIGIAPDFAQAHRGLAALKRYTADDEHLTQMEAAWQRSSGSSRAELGFALASVQDSLGNHEACLDYLKEANALRRAELAYDGAADRSLFERIRACDFEGVPERFEDAAEVQPILVVGMMRSGTSLVEQILASHASVHGGGELEFLNRLIVPMFPASGAPIVFGAEEAAALRSGYLASLQALDTSSTFVTDKMPLNFRWLGFVLAALPEARVVHVSRDPRAICWSIYKHYFADEGNAYAYDMEDITAYYEQYVHLMTHWRERYGGRIYDLSYESMTENQEAETRSLLEFCGLDWDPRCLEFHKTKRAVTTSSAAQVRKAMYTGSSDAWRNYETFVSGFFDNSTDESLAAD